MLKTQSTGHGRSLHCFVTVLIGQALPPYAGGTATLLSRKRMPPPQLFEQCPHSVKELCTQCTGHILVPHARCCDVAPHALPPCCWAVATLRDRTCVEPPHVTAHVVHALQSCKMQSTGQGVAPQDCSSTSAGHSAPPCIIHVVTLRKRRCEPPPPHEALHASHSPYSPTAQSIGHAAVLQSDSSVSVGHCTPPKPAATSMARERVCLPPLHERVHAPQSLHFDVTQSRGQLLELQPSVCVSDGHARPPCAGTVEIPRARSLVPPPQVKLHAPQANHVATSQSIGQAPVLHACVSTK